MVNFSQFQSDRPFWNSLWRAAFQVVGAKNSARYTCVQLLSIRVIVAFASISFSFLAVAVGNNVRTA